MEAAVATAAAARAGAAATDGELVGAVRRGDDAAFAELYGRYHRPIAGFVARMVRDHARAEDVTQDVFLSALRRIRATDEEISVRPWLYEIARNASIDQFRRSTRAQEVSYDGDAAAGGLVAGDATPDVVVERKQQLDFLRGALGGLTETQHQVLVLRELEGRSYREIGERLAMTEGAVESTLFRARKRLGEEFQDLVTGERCVRVQALIGLAGESELGARDRRRASRHLVHCRACRVHAHAAGLDALVPAPRSAISLGLGGLLPLPLLLRRRLGGGSGGPADDGGQVTTLAGWISGTGGSLEPTVALGKAAVTAAAVAAVGLGAGPPPGGDARRDQVRGVVSAPARTASAPAASRALAPSPAPRTLAAPSRQGRDGGRRAGTRGPDDASPRPRARDGGVVARAPARETARPGSAAAVAGPRTAPPVVGAAPGPAGPAAVAAPPVDPVLAAPAAPPDAVASARAELDTELDTELGAARAGSDRQPDPAPAPAPATDPPVPGPPGAGEPGVAGLEQRLAATADEVERRTTEAVQDAFRRVPSSASRTGG